MKTREKWFTLPVVGGLAVVFFSVTGLVLGYAPVDLSPDQLVRLEAIHESLNYYYIGEIMAKRELGPSALRWSHNFLDRSAACYQLLDGYWVACGWVQVREGDKVVTYPWVVCFRPEANEPLFVRAGFQSKGDFKQMTDLEARTRAAHPLYFIPTP